MPKATKEAQIDNEKDVKVKSTKTASKSTKTATEKKKTTTAKKSTSSEKKATSTKKSATKKSTTTDKKTTSAKSKTTTSKASTTKKSTTSKSTTAKKTNTAKKTTKTTATKAKSTTRKSTVGKKKTVAKKLEENVVAEYYDLPYRYNETIVKILYQTPTILFVYWDISDYDRDNFIKQYGENFFNNTRPILKVYNLTKNYDFEVEINDFANSWYINVNDANCVYKVELSRKTIRYEEKLDKDYIYVSSSNYIEFPNDRILLDELPNTINFKNVKTNAIYTKDIGTLHLVGINKIYKPHDFYKKFYKDEILEEFDRKIFVNPSSSSWS